MFEAFSNHAEGQSLNSRDGFVAVRAVDVAYMQAAANRLSSSTLPAFGLTTGSLFWMRFATA